MNKFTIILLTSFLLTLIQIANALPMHEAAVHREPTNDSPKDNVPSDSNDRSDSVPEVEDSTDEENSGGEVSDDDQGDDGVKNYRNMEHLMHDAIFNHLGHYDLDSMSAETEQRLYEMFCEMEIIPAEE